MTKRGFGFMIDMALVAGCMLVHIAGIRGAEPVRPESVTQIQSEVTKRDPQGRVLVMETRASKGTCVAKILYDEVPRIYVVVISHEEVRNLGYLQINYGTKESLSDKALMKAFTLAISERCLRFIVPGYAAV